MITRNSKCYGRKSIFLFILIYVALNSAIAQSDSTYGYLKINETTGSIVRIKHDKFNQGNINNPEQLIQDKVAGLSVNRPGSNPNEGFNMRLRGLNSINGRIGPLVVIDGMIDATLEDVDPNDIESITVLKDVSSTSIYGLRGSGGVILVTTKKGEIGKILIEYNGSATAEMIAKTPPSMNSSEWRALSKETGLGTDFGTNTDWFKEITQTAISQVQNIALSGGRNSTNYRASFNYRNGDGILINTGYTKLSGRINLIQKAFKDKFIVDLNLGATQRKSKVGFDEAFQYAAIYNPTSPVKSEKPEYTIWDGYTQQILYNYYNPVAIQELDKNEAKTTRLNMSVNGGFELIKGLVMNAFYSFQTHKAIGSQFYDKKDYWKVTNSNDLYLSQQDDYSGKYFESNIHYSNNKNTGFNISVMAGYTNQNFTQEVSGNKSIIKDIGYFGHLDLNIKKLYFISINGSYENSSLLNKGIFFPSISGAIDLAKLTNVSTTNELRFRAGYGITGNQPKVYTSTFDIKPEKTGEFDAGIDFSLFNTKLTGSLDYYSKITSDLIYKYYSLVPPDFWGLINNGKLKNSGLELSLEYKFIRKSDFSYSISLTPSYILANSISLPGTVNGYQDLGSMGSPGQNQVPLVRVEDGKPVGQLLAFIFKDIDASGNLTFVDQNHDGKIDNADRRVVGNGLPKFTIGFGNIIKYKNWDLNIFFRAVFGHDLINSFRGLYEVPQMISSYNLPVTATDMRNPNGTLMKTASGILSNKDVENASFVSLGNTSLGYSFKLNEYSRFSRIKLYFAGNNLFYITRYKGADPNPRYTDNDKYLGSYSSPLVPGVDRLSSWPRARSVSLGANFVF